MIGTVGVFCRGLVPAMLCISGLLMVAGARAQSEPAAHQHQHQHDHSAVMAAAIKRSEVNYHIPTLSLVRQDGKKAAFPAELDDGRPVMLQFIYTSCTTICPVTTRNFARVQEAMGKESSQVHMVSISIDPEYDTPARLDAYARQYGAGAQWQFYTGTLQNSVSLQKAFDAYRGDKMNHTPVIFLRLAPGKPWVRLDGLASADETLKQYRTLVAAR